MLIKINKMKKININRTNIIQKNLNSQYIVCIGNYSVSGAMKHYLFSSEKKAEIFIKKTNKFLTDALHELNIMYGNLLYEYRINWGIFNDCPSSYRTKRTVSDCLKSSEECFNRIIFYSLARTPNSGHFIFKMLNNICSYLSDVAEILIEVNKKRSVTNNVYHYKFILNEVIRVFNSINSYAKTTQLYVSARQKDNKPIKRTNRRIDRHNQKVRSFNLQLKNKRINASK